MVGRGRGGEDLALVAAAHQPGQKADVVDVRVGDEHEVQVGRVVVVQVEVALLDFLVALVHAAVDAEAVAGGFEDSRSR